MKQLIFIFTCLSISIFAKQIGNRDFAFPSNVDEWENFSETLELIDLDIYMLKGDDDIHMLFSSFLPNVTLEEKDEYLEEFDYHLSGKLRNVDLHETDIISEDESSIFTKEIIVFESDHVFRTWRKVIETEEGLIILHFLFASKKSHDLSEEAAAWEDFLLQAS